MTQESKRATRLPVLLALLFAFGLPARCRLLASSNEMAFIPTAIYQPLFRSASEPGLVRVRAFRLDVFPISNGDFLGFVRARPEWRRSSVSRAVADETYLRHWAGDLHPGPLAPSNTPVTFVSWFAAKAFAEWKGRRLPTTAEWELAAAASPARPDGYNDVAFMRQVTHWYMTPAPETIGLIGRGTPNCFGVHDLHGLVWEWVAEVNLPANAADARARTNRPPEAFCGGGADGARDARDYPAFMRTSFRGSLQPAYTVHNLGFRCAQSVEVPGLRSR